MVKRILEILNNLDLSGINEVTVAFNPEDGKYRIALRSEENTACTMCISQYEMLNYFDVDVCLINACKRLLAQLKEYSK